MSKKLNEERAMMEAERLMACMGALADPLPRRCTSAVAKILLLSSPFFSHGRMFDTYAKSVGAGVYEVHVRERM